MTMDEFRTWLDGFCAGLEGEGLSAEKWQQVCEKVAELDQPPWLKEEREWQPYTTTSWRTAQNHNRRASDH